MLPQIIGALGSLGQAGNSSTPQDVESTLTTKTNITPSIGLTFGRGSTSQTPTAATTDGPASGGAFAIDQNTMLLIGGGLLVLLVAVVVLRK